MTKKFAVLGSPISHSLSPRIHKAAFEFYQTEATYTSFEVTELSAFLDSHKDYSGFSLTMPLKDQAYLASLIRGGAASKAECVNTLVARDGAWLGYNTDVFGIQQALGPNIQKEALVIGTGATARSAIVALQEMDQLVSVWGRDSQKAKQLSQKYGVSLVQDLDKSWDQQLVVSTLPGTALDPYLGDDWTPSGVLLDVAYNPWPSKAAKLWSIGGKAISGIEMLIWQAIAQQRLFHGNALDQQLDREGELHFHISKALGMAK